MKMSIHGSIAVAALCALLTACGGGSSGSGGTPPTALPASVSIDNDARTEAGTAATFKTDLATTAGLTFRWDFGDGTSGSGATASHAYAKPGTYGVTVAVANDAEDLRTATSTIEVGAYANVTGLSCSQAGFAGWCWQHAIATGNQINDVLLVDATHAWAVGNNLTILKSSDGGTTWSQVSLDATLAPASLRSVRFYDAMHGMALDDHGGALQTADGGATWAATSLGSSVNGSPTTFVDYRAGRIIVQGAYGNGALSVDGGTTWTGVAASGPLLATSAGCWSFGSGVQLAAGCGNTAATALTPFPNGYTYSSLGTFSSDSQALVLSWGIVDYTTFNQAVVGWSTTDGGLTWTPFTPTGLYPYSYYGLVLHMTDAQSGVIYNPSDLMAYTTADGGRSWTSAVSSASLTQAFSYYRATGVVANGVLWQSAGNHLSLSTDNGQTWHDTTVHAEDTVTQFGQSTAAAVTQYSDADHFVVAISHRFYVTADGGQTYRQVLGPDARDAGSQYATGEFSDIHHGKFLTANGALLSTTDGGRTWTRQDYPNPAGSSSAGMPVAIHFTTATDGWLVLAGKLAHSSDGGSTWSSPLTGSGMADLTGMSWGDSAHAWTWTGAGNLFATADGGATWTQVTTLPANFSVGSAVMTGPLTGVADSYYGGVVTTQDGGATWQAAVGASGLGRLVHTTGQTVWSLNGYSLQRSKDGGRTWKPAGPAGGLSYAGISFADDMRGWLISGTGDVLHTIDGGDSWTAQPLGSGLSLQGVVALDAMTAWAITSDGQILATATAGN